MMEAAHICHGYIPVLDAVLAHLRPEVALEFLHHYLSMIQVVYKPKLSLIVAQTYSVSVSTRFYELHCNLSMSGFDCKVQRCIAYDEKE